jgi:tRNA pseudouridine38-40 synthase
MTNLRGERRVLLSVAYDGSGASGWQIQPDRRTIQGELEAAVARVLGEPSRVDGASRTDSGVHALGQAAALTTSSAVPAERIVHVLNRALPPDIRVRTSREVATDFYPRAAAYGKIYRYTWLIAGGECPFLRRYTERIPRRPDVAAMREAAVHIVGEHDFRAFQNASDQAPPSTVRTIWAVDIHEEDRLVHVQVAGSGFLYNMVRNIAGTLLDVGYGRRSPGAVATALAARDRRLAGPTASARGLCLLGVYFDADGLARDLLPCTLTHAWANAFGPVDDSARIRGAR